MTLYKAIALAVGVGAVVLMGGTASADDYTLVPTGGPVSWQNNATWTSGTGVTFPNSSSDTANLSIGLTSNLALDVGATDVTVGALTMGGTAGAVTSDVISTGGNLILNNAAANATITSGGVAGSTNRISAPVVLGDTVDIPITNTNSLTIGGNVSMTGAGQAIINHMVHGQQLVFNGTINLHEVGVPATGLPLTPSGDAGAINIYNGPFVSGTADSGLFFNGPGTNLATSFMTHVLNVASPSLTNTVGIGFATVIVGNNQALGTGNVTLAGGHRTHLRSDDSSRTLANNFVLGGGGTFDGNNSLTLGGWMNQTNGRAIVNNIAAGSTLTLTGTGAGNTNMDSIYVFESDDASATRQFIIDGRGNTVVQGRIRDTEVGTVATSTHHLTKRGSGTLTLNNTTINPNDYTGETRANGGLVNFAAINNWGAGNIIVNANGGVWFAPGSAHADFPTFLGKIATASTGALAIPASEAATNFNFTAAPLLNAATMSIGAQGAVTYTGTVTPGASGYFWGGMTGTLTLSGTNKMTGANAVTYRNGGKVIVPGTQDYTGVTTIAGANLATGQDRADRRDPAANQNTENIFLSTTLETSAIANGGVPSTLGASTSDAANLVFNGGTLRYTGSGGSTNRLFTIGTGGATLDASGTGALTFNNAGALAGTGSPLILTGSSTANNTLASLMGDGASAQAVTKRGDGKWILSGTNNYLGVTRVESGILSITNPFLHDLNDVQMFGGTLDLNFPVGTPDTIDELFIGGAPQAAGTWGSLSSSATNKSAFFTGTGILNVSTFNISMLAGDFNQNGVVDAADYVLWRENLNQPVTLPNIDPTDIDGTVTDAEYNWWRARFGNTVVTGAALGGSTIPEPAAGVLLAIILVSGCFYRVKGTALRSYR